MRRRQGSIRERTKGSFELRYSLKADPVTGRRRTATATIKAEKRGDAEKELRRLLRSVDTGEHVDPTRMLVREYLAAWLATAREEVSPRTHERYAELVRHFLLPALGNQPLAKLTSSQIQAVYTTLATGGRRDGKPGGLAARTRRQIHAVLHSALARAVEDQLIARNPAAVFKKKRLPKVPQAELVTLTAQQSAALLTALSHSRVYWPVLLALTTGMRRGEVLALRWRHVDFNRGTVAIVASVEQTKEGLRFKSTKTDRARAVALPGYAVDELRRLKFQQAEELLLLGVRQTGDALVCSRADGKPLQPRSLTHEFTALISRLPDFPRVRFHDLRHSAATQLLALGVHPKIVQERLGHSTIATTMNIYSHVADTMQEDAAARLDAVLRDAVHKVRS
jgi:integrase